jgi:flagellar motor protein MotB
MKKSNLFVLAAVIILFASLVSYNTTLRAQYVSGVYKDPYRNFETLNLKNFNAVAVNAASEISVTIRQGPNYKVQLFTPDADKIKVTQEGNQLLIDAKYQQDRRYLGDREKVVITLPTLQMVTTNASYTIDNKPFTHGKNKHEWSNASTKIIGFTQDSLFIQQDNLNKIELINNKLGFLHVISGASPGSSSRIQINSNNTIARANLDIRNKGELSLTDIFIPNPTYQFSDSARLNLSGPALAILKK